MCGLNLEAHKAIACMVCVVKMVDIWISLPGVLCGQCREPYGVGMLTMKCQEFTAKFPMYYWLMPLLSESSVHTLLRQSVLRISGREGSII